MKQNQKQYKLMTEYDFLELVHTAVQKALQEAHDNGAFDGIPQLTTEELENVSFENSFQSHRIVFFPEECRQVTLTITSQEEEDEVEDE